MRVLVLICLCLALTACGVDGPPASVPGGVSISGGAKIGVRGSL